MYISPFIHSHSRIIYAICIMFINFEEFKYAVLCLPLYCSTGLYVEVDMGFGKYLLTSIAILFRESNYYSNQ